MSEKPTVEQFTEKARTILSELLRMLGFDAKIQSFAGAENEVLLHIESTDAARLIGRGAQVLNALQFILNRIVNRNEVGGVHFVVDVERYRERRKDRLLKDALAAAERVERTGNPVEMDPMGSSDRRIIHQALKDHPNVTTYSEEAEERDQKRVIVCRPDQAQRKE